MIRYKRNDVRLVIDDQNPLPDQAVVVVCRFHDRRESSLPVAPGGSGLVSRTGTKLQLPGAVRVDNLL